MELWKFGERNRQAINSRDTYEPTILFATSTRSFTLSLGKAQRKEGERESNGRSPFFLAGFSAHLGFEVPSLHFLEQIVHFCGSTAHELQERTTMARRKREETDERASERANERTRVMIFLKPLWRISLLSSAVKHDNKTSGLGNSA